MQRIVITGSSGYLGRKLVATLLKQGKTVLGIDITNAPDDGGPSEFHQADICDENLLEVVRSFAPDTIVHAAFIVKPIRDTKRMTAVNIGGTDNMIRIVREVRPNRFLFVSSATALGAWPDNPIPLPDTWIPRARPEFQYAADKTALEGKVSALAAEIPDTAVSWIRPAVVGGPKVDNYLSRFIFNNPMLVKIDGEDSTVQFVHEDDVVGATCAILEADARGPFNVGPADWTTISLIAGETNRRTISLPFGVVWWAAWLAWKVHYFFHESPPGFLYFAKYPWVVSADRLRDEVGYKFQYSAEETMRAIIDGRRKK
jgi:UDP-glucose 4-epimerase